MNSQGVKLEFPIRLTLLYLSKYETGGGTGGNRQVEALSRSPWKPRGHAECSAPLRDEKQGVRVIMERGG